jgi:hypothetical protein
VSGEKRRAVAGLKKSSRVSLSPSLPVDLDAFMPVFTDDAIILAPGAADVRGKEAIPAMYATAMEQVNMSGKFSTHL